MSDRDAPTPRDSGPDPVGVRPATPEDVPSIVRRWRELIEVHQAIEPDLFALSQRGEDAFRAFLRRQLKDRGSARVFVADEGRREILGYVVARLGVRAPFYRVLDVGVIFDLAVAPARRGEGIGQALMGAVDAWFRSEGIEYVQVNYSPANESASRFWERSGYRAFLTESYRRL